MEKRYFLIGIILACGLCYYAGWVFGSFVCHDPTPEECLSVCVEEFEKMAG